MDAGCEVPKITLYGRLRNIRDNVFSLSESVSALASRLDGDVSANLKDVPETKAVSEHVDTILNSIESKLTQISSDIRRSDNAVGQ